MSDNKMEKLLKNTCLRKFAYMLYRKVLLLFSIQKASNTGLGIYELWLWYDILCCTCTNN